MKKNSQSILHNLLTTKAPAKKAKTDKPRYTKGSPHANTQRHIAGLRKHFSKKQMEKEATYLLSINYIQMKPRALENKPKLTQNFGTTQNIVGW